jgi:hypothetical protein
MYGQRAKHSPHLVQRSARNGPAVMSPGVVME